MNSNTSLLKNLRDLQSDLYWLEKSILNNKMIAEMNSHMTLHKKTWSFSVNLPNTEREEVLHYEDLPLWPSALSSITNSIVSNKELHSRMNKTLSYLRESDSWKGRREVYNKISNIRDLQDRKVTLQEYITKINNIYENGHFSVDMTPKDSCRKTYPITVSIPTCKSMLQEQVAETEDKQLSLLVELQDTVEEYLDQ